MAPWLPSGADPLPAWRSQVHCCGMADSGPCWGGGHPPSRPRSKEVHGSGSAFSRTLLPTTEAQGRPTPLPPGLAGGTAPAGILQPVTQTSGNGWRLFYKLWSHGAWGRGHACRAVPESRRWTLRPPSDSPSPPPTAPLAGDGEPRCSPPGPCLLGRTRGAGLAGEPRASHRLLVPWKRELRKS